MFILLFDIFAEQYHCAQVIQEEDRLNSAHFKEFFQVKLSGLFEQVT